MWTVDRPLAIDVSHVHAHIWGWTDGDMNVLQKMETTEHTHGVPAGHCKGEWVKIFERLPGGR